jgi:Flp pilus assembly protein TadB
MATSRLKAYQMSRRTAWRACAQSIEKITIKQKNRCDPVLSSFHQFVHGAPHTSLRSFLRLLLGGLVDLLFVAVVFFLVPLLYVLFYFVHLAFYRSSIQPVLVAEVALPRK